MKLPRIVSRIERRLLVNYRADPEVVARLLPDPFRPQLADGAAVVGICLIRLGATRPVGFPRRIGLRSENAAHRIAVQWDGPEGTRSGVYIPRRDSGARLTVALGGRLFPGAHHRALFKVQEAADQVDIAYTSVDDNVSVDVSVRFTDGLRSGLFSDLQSASRFFERGADGFSATHNGSGLEGLRLRSTVWRVEPAEVLRARSSFFEDARLFPAGSVTVDHALIMRNVPVDWLALEPPAQPGARDGAWLPHL